MAAERAGAPHAPIILISRAEDVLGERWDDYAEAIVAAGGDARAVDLGEAADALPPFDGLMVTAGFDVDPARYGQQRSDRVQEVDAERDAFEEALFARAYQLDVPVLAVCRGHQLLNTWRGGSLLQHLEQREPHRARRGPDGESIDSGWHDVAVAPGSLLATVTGATRGAMLHVNSRHHQAVPPDGVGEGLVATGIAPDGVVEAVEDPSRDWVLGIQWHPERPEMRDDPRYAAGSTVLFEAFVTACAHRAAREYENAS
jgi:putative glutamine amidotransferase